MSRTLSPCGTIAARRRHNKQGQTCETCKAGPPTPLQPCGTPAAWRRHRAHGETPCDACTIAIRAHDTKRRANKQGPPRPTTHISTPELITELTFLINAGEGTARILEATGYTGREKALRDRLNKTQHKHLIPRILQPWDLAA